LNAEKRKSGPNAKKGTDRGGQLLTGGSHQYVQITNWGRWIEGRSRIKKTSYVEKCGKGPWVGGLLDPGRATTQSRILESRSKYQGRNLTLRQFIGWGKFP